MIAIITNKDDITSDFIVNRLNKIGTEYLRLNTEDLVSETGINFDILYRDQNSLLLYHKGLTVNLSDIKSVYYRRPLLPNVKMDFLSDGENQFLARENSYALEGLYKVLRKCFWISPVDSIRQAENKIYQLLIAQDVGFEIPHSLITTSADKARAFFEQFGGDCIIKPIKNGQVGDDRNQKIIFTSSLKGRDINWMKAVGLCPIYLQPNIKKTADIRVTVVGDKVFSAIIHSQEFEETVIDWRKGANISVRHQRMQLPSDIEEKCVELIRQLGLSFGAIDFVLDKNGRYIFLEINPNGQWGWIEKRLGYGISEEIVRLLLKED